MEYRNFDECLAYIEDLMIKHGPFDGLMGFSQVCFITPTRIIQRNILKLLFSSSNFYI